MESAWNLHGTSTKIILIRRHHATITFRHKNERILYEIYINSLCNLHGYSIKEDAIHASGVDAGNIFDIV
jgi:hypothetical protein